MKSLHFYALIGIGILLIAAVVVFSTLSSDSNGGGSTTSVGTGAGSGSGSGTGSGSQTGQNQTAQNQSGGQTSQGRNQSAEQLAIEIVKSQPVVQQLEDYVTFTNGPGFIEKAKTEILKYISSVPGYEPVYEKNKDLISSAVDMFLGEAVLKSVDYGVQRISDTVYSVTMVLNGRATTDWYKVDLTNGKVLQKSENLKVVLEGVDEASVIKHVRNVIINSMTDWLLKLGKGELQAYETNGTGNATAGNST